MKQSIKLLLGGAFLLSLPMFLTSCEDILGEWSKPTPSIVTPSDGGGESSANKYLAWNATSQKLEQKDLPTSFKEMTTTETSWSGTYIVDKDVEITGDVTLTGDVDLIILDGKTLSLASDKKIGSATFNLNIYGQSTGTSAGKLVVSTVSDTSYYPFEIGGTLNIHSGNVNATATGAGNQAIYAAKCNIYGGTVVAKGTGVAFMTEGLAIYDGADVTATSTGTDGVGIVSYDNPLNISGSNTKVTATGDMHGIETQASAVLTIDGGTIIANAGATSANQGGNAIEGIITINGGTVTATGGDGVSGAAGGAGINGTLTINGGTVTATGGNGDGAGDGGIGIQATTIVTDCVKVTATGGNKGGTGSDGEGFDYDGGSTIKIATSLKYSVDGVDQGAGTNAAITIADGNKTLVVEPNS